MNLIFLKKKIFKNFYLVLVVIIFSIISQLLSIYLYYNFFIQFSEIDIKILFFVIPITNLLISMSFFTFNGIGIREILFINFTEFFSFLQKPFLILGLTLVLF